MTAGIDVSVWQGAIDWPAVAGDDIGFAWAKATEATFYRDPTFDQNMAGAKAAGVRFGAYHFAGSSVRSVLYDAAVEAEFFVANSHPAHWTLPPALDLELHYGWTADQLTGWALGWVERVRALTGWTAVLYTGSYFPLVWDRLDDLDLWLAQYTASGTIDPDPLAIRQPSLPASRTAGWQVWQYTSEGRVAGVAGNCDRNIATGSWWDEVTGAAAPDELPLDDDQEDEMADYVLRVTAGNAYFMHPGDPLVPLTPDEADEFEDSGGARRVVLSHDTFAKFRDIYSVVEVRGAG